MTKYEFYSCYFINRCFKNVSVTKYCLLILLMGIQLQWNNLQAECPPNGLSNLTPIELNTTDFLARPNRNNSEITSDNKTHTNQELFNGTIVSIGIHWTSYISVSVVLPIEICNNGLDDDGDSLVDCADDECDSDPSCVDTDSDGIIDISDLDDDNDGIPDTVEHLKTVLWVLDGAISSDQQNTIDKLSNLGFTVTVADDDDSEDANNYAVTFIHPSVDSGSAFTNILNLATTSNGVMTSENALLDEIMGTTSPTGTPATNLINIINNTHPITQGLAPGNLDIGNGDYYVTSIVTGTKLGRHPDGTDNLVAWDVGETMDTGIAPGRRVAAPITSYNGGFNANGEDLLVNAILWTWAKDTDSDGIYDDHDLDSDNDGIFDLVEAGHLSPDVDSDGVIDGMASDFGANGLYDGLETSADSGVLSYTIQDTDFDGNINSIEIDSDGDGCNDVIESGFPDSDGDGQLGGLVPPSVNASGVVTSGGL